MWVFSQRCQQIQSQMKALYNRVQHGSLFCQPSKKYCQMLQISSLFAGSTSPSTPTAA